MAIKSVYKKFKGTEEYGFPNTLNKRFDEPTYISFKLHFGSSGDVIYNYAGNRALYDTMPHPLFNLLGGVNENLQTNSVIVTDAISSYSAYDYLINANEPTRAKMLLEFIHKFNDLQNNFSYYFQSVTGVADLIKIDTKKGQRIGNEQKVSISCLEGIDLRISYLMNLYRKIVWDDVYQRWVLPDMMRYFTLDIYMSEFRTMHVSTAKAGTKVYGYGNDEEIEFAQAAAANIGGSIPSQSDLLQSSQSSSVEGVPRYLKILDNILPVWKITCEMCEFDLSDISFDYTNDLKVDHPPEVASVKLGIKVGNIKETQVYPVFESAFLIDRKLNGLARADEENSTLLDNNRNLYPDYLRIAQNRTGEEIYHISGTGYNERQNQNTTGDAKGAMTGEATDNFNASRRETWIGNAVTFGTSYAKNFANKVIDKGKVTSIPGLGVSFNEIVSALESKNIVSAIGLIRKGINQVVQDFGGAPSNRLQGGIETDSILRNFLIGVTQSQATDKQTLLLQGAANMALNDAGVWNQIKDFSFATDLVGPGEINTKKQLLSAGELGDATVSVATKGTVQGSGIEVTTDTVKKIDVVQIIDAPPSSSLSNKIEGNRLTQPTPSKATNSKLE